MSNSFLNFLLLHLSRQSRKELKKLEKNLKSGKCDISNENAFHLFLLATPIKYCSYSDSKNVLGSTYGMCVLQVSPLCPVALHCY